MKTYNFFQMILADFPLIEIFNAYVQGLKNNPHEFSAIGIFYCGKQIGKEHYI